MIHITKKRRSSAGHGSTGILTALITSLLSLQGWAFNPNLDSEVFTQAIQNDGKVLIGGLFQKVGGVSRNRIARLNKDGSLDPSFDPGSGVNSSVLTLAIQSDNKILIGGGFVLVNDVERKRIARLNTDGSIDSTFNPNLEANGTVFALALQADGKIIMAGNFTQVNGVTRNRIARLNTDGNLDTTFSTGSGANESVRALAIQPNGKILMAGRFTIVRGNTRNHIARLNDDSSVDQSFNSSVGANNFINAMTLQSDGKILIGGDYTKVNGDNRNRIARLNGDSSLDQTFNTGTGADKPVTALALQNDGKVLMGGFFTFVRGNTLRYFARLNTDGAVDQSFNIGSGASNLVSALTVQPNGKIILGGAFTAVDGINRNRMARLNKSGSLEQIINPVEEEFCFPINASNGNVALICL